MTMILSGILIAAVVWSLLYGTIGTLPLGLLCGGLALWLGVLGHHKHGSLLTIDLLAQRSRLAGLNASLKVWGALALLFLCVATPHPAFGLGMAAVMLLVTVGVGRVRLHDYLSLLALPAAFLLMSCLALLWDWSAAPVGVLNLPLFGGWLTVTAAAQTKTALVMARAIGAVSCLYFLSLSTPMSEIIAALRKAHVPALVVELMYLIYRYIFILLEMHRAMGDAAASRLGYHSFRASLRTTGRIYANLLARSFQRANQCFDAMESRCYDGEIRFLEPKKPLTMPQGLATGALFAASVTLAAAGLLR